MDLVPNHTSSAHPWFQAALASSPGSDQRERYIFRDGTGPGGVHPPNNWVSIFGGPAWTRVVEADGNPGQWYLHLFDAEQPDLNWDNPEVFDDLEKTLRFWLERGVDGFRIDVAHGMAKPPGLPDMEVIKAEVLLADMDDDPRFNNDGVHDIHRQIRSVFNDYPDAVAIGEVWVYDNEQFARYVRPDELHLGFNFRLLRAEFDADDIRGAIENSMAAAAIAGATPTWTLANHDVDREPTRYGGGPIGLARARAMALVMLALPGAVFLYNGEELGLPNVDLPDEALRDPVWERSGHTRRGRDACRVPMPWEGDAPPFGFSDRPRHLAAASAGVGGADGGTAARRSPHRHCRSSVGRSNCAGQPCGIRRHDIEWLDSPAGGLVFRRSGGLVCVLNAGRRPMPLPSGEVLLASGEMVDGELPPNTAAWLVCLASRRNARFAPRLGSLRLSRRMVSAAPARGRRGGGTPSRSARRYAATTEHAHPNDLVGRDRRRARGPALPLADCGRKPIAVKANTQRIGIADTRRVARADRDHLLIQQRHRRP